MNHTVPQGQFAMIGISFEGTDSKPMQLDKLITGNITPLYYDWEDDTVFDRANMIEIYKGNDDYDFAYYIENGWDDDLNDGEGDYFTGWCDGGYKVTKTLEPGDAIWFKARTGDQTFSTPGQVYMGETEITVPAGQFQMFGFDKPMELDFNDPTQVTFRNCVALKYDWEDDTVFDRANMIEIYKGNDDYNFLYYIEDGWDDSLNDGEGDYFTGWTGGDGYRPTEKVPVSRGMWAKGRQGSFDIIFVAK